MQNLGRAMRRINKVGMRRSEIAGELVQCVVTDESAGRHAQHTIFGVKFLNCSPSASRITFTENFRKIAVEQRLDTTHICAHGRRGVFFTGMLVHEASLYALPWCGLWGDRETAIIESHRFRFVGV
jgi:hypothetical protein